MLSQDRPALSGAAATLLDMASPQIRSYPPATVVAEKFQAMVALGVANGRMKDYHDLWALPQSVPVTPAFEQSNENSFSPWRPVREVVVLAMARH